ncbi:unnamed protein product [Rotaria sordida]|uniref:F-box domain-containing protein n=1 Tax=Rotaria sordida TaxID=392033 RepID=A0A816AIE3_9BILA|nr:unnamed protein product [Rotaria sordida]CAF1596214.1 unnamed protein product [Rotaria sordida]
MNSHFEIFSPEILYEIFDYLPISDIFHAFISLNHHLNNIINLHSLKVDFRKLSRLKFDFVYHYLQPEQVILFIFSNENMAEQVLIFHRYFPHYKYQFINLRTLTFEGCIYVGKELIDTILRQTNSLTYLKVDCIHILQLMDTYFDFDYLSHYLTNLTLIYLINKVDFSHKLIQNYLMKLSNLKYLTLSIALDLIDGEP